MDSAKKLAEAQSVRLWTWQGCGYDIRDAQARYDRNRARYYADQDLPCAKEAYERLFKKMGTDQFIWCYTHKPLHPDRGAKWVLRLPVKRVLAFVDSLAWSRILGQWNAFPPKALHDKVRELTRSDPTQEEVVRKRLENDINARYEGEDLWELLFVPPPCEEPSWDHSVSALVPLPVDPGWVAEGPS